MGSSGVDRLAIAADHRAVAVLQAPDAAADAGVDEADAALGHERVAALAVLEVGVAAVDDRVALGEQRRRTPPWCASVASPAGTISQTMRGVGSLATASAGREGAIEALGHDVAHLVPRSGCR